jgi:hypothetical protein
MPAFTLREDDPESFRAFFAILDRNDDKTIAAHLTTLRDLAAWRLPGAWRPSPSTATSRRPSPMG